jgi:imidazolonepropionase-like amidohydrolase
LLAGFTTVRMVGAGGFEDVGLRNAVNGGYVPGPRIATAGHSLGITGGHCDENNYRPGLIDGTPQTGIADGVVEVRQAVRYQVKYGADVIKTCATAGVLSGGTQGIGASQYSLEELSAMVDEAGKLGRKVVAHAHGTDAEAMETVVAASASVAGHSLRDLRFPKGAILGGIVRDEKVIMPRGSDALQAGDHAIFFVLPEAIGAVEELLA